MVEEKILNFNAPERRVKLYFPGNNSQSEIIYWKKIVFAVDFFCLRALGPHKSVKHLGPVGRALPHPACSATDQGESNNHCELNI